MFKYKRLFFLIFILGFLSFNVGFSELKYNSTYDNLTVDPNWWCKGMEAVFKIYDEKEFNNLTFKDNLCVGSDTPDRDNCNVFTNITGTYKLYAGPIDSLPVLSEGSIQNSEIRYKFNDVNDYLVEIVPDGNYNQLNTRLVIHECEESSQLINKTVKKQEDNYVLNLNLINLRVIDENLAKIDLIDDPSLSFSRADLENLSSYKKDVFLFNFENPDFENYSLILENLDLNRETNIYIFDSGFNIFKSFKNITNSSFKVLDNDNIKNFYLVIFSKNKKTSIVQNNSSVDDNNVNENKSNNITQVKEFQNDSNNNLESSSLGGNQENLAQNDNKEPEKNIETKEIPTDNNTSSSSSSAGSSMIIIVIIVILILALVGFLIMKKPKPKKEEPKTEGIEVLSTYEQAMNRTKEYINKYKDSYSKDQIYRALKLAQIPDDIIDKAFNEIYGK